MANRTLGTRQKLVFRGPGKGPGKTGGLNKPRNPLVLPALQRKAGAHVKTPGAQRQAAKREVARQFEDKGMVGPGKDPA